MVGKMRSTVNAAVCAVALGWQVRLEGLHHLADEDDAVTWSGHVFSLLPACSLTIYLDDSCHAGEVSSGRPEVGSGFLLGWAEVHLSGGERRAAAAGGRRRGPGRRRCVLSTHTTAADQQTEGQRRHSNAISVPYVAALSIDSKGSRGTPRHAVEPAAAAQRSPVSDATTMPVTTASCLLHQPLPCPLPVPSSTGFIFSENHG